MSNIWAIAFGGDEPSFLIKPTNTPYDSCNAFTIVVSLILSRIVQGSIAQVQYHSIRYRLELICIYKYKNNKVTVFSHSSIILYKRFKH